MRTPIVISLLSCLFFSAAVGQERRVSLLFAGDAMQHLPQVNAAKTADGGYDYDTCFSFVKEKISAADIAGVNFETTLAGKPYTGYPMFSSPDEFAAGLKKAGFNLFFQANNHAADRGKKGLERTIDILDSLAVKHTGTFKSKETRSLHYPLMMIKNGIRIAFLNYSYDTNGLPVPKPNIVNPIDTNLIKRDIFFTRLYKPDIIIAHMHWGNEYQTYPSRTQKALAELLFRHGVRIVIGHHPHVVQPYAVYEENGQIQNVVYYSLGNFISNQQQTNTDGGMMAEIVVSKKDDSASVTIESCDYSLVWVRKFSHGTKKHYVLIPAQNNKINTLNEAEKQKMNTFVQNAERIIGRGL